VDGVKVFAVQAEIVAGHQSEQARRHRAVQPIFALNDSHVVGCEALLRWSRPALGQRHLMNSYISWRKPD
jgi:EAL domain-containing protein (putative c-di-GMP-specific phosphodiesterase class I)